MHQDTTASVLNLGSLNLDHVYRVDHFVRPGETLPSREYRRFPGGKGLNQSIALARAGARVRHLGAVGPAGDELRDRLEKEGVDNRHLRRVEETTGHAVIQVTPHGENAIVLHGGANYALEEGWICEAIGDMNPGDCFLLQNETSHGARAIELAHAKGLRVVFNPAPFAPELGGYPLECVDLLIANETEAEGLCGSSRPEDVQNELRRRFPGMAVVLTLGAAGALYFDATQTHRVTAPRVEAVDTTAAGDTFLGFFLAGQIRGLVPAEALRLACRAAALSVTRRGAADSIPQLLEVQNCELL